MGGYLPGYPDITRAHPILLYARALDISISENTHARNRTCDSKNGVAYCGNFRISQSRLLKGTNCLFASKDHVRPVSKWLCIIFMACSFLNFVLGHYYNVTYFTGSAYNVALCRHYAVTSVTTSVLFFSNFFQLINYSLANKSACRVQ